MVRLRLARLVLGRDGVALFQFHMVRLRPCGLACRGSWRRISIPHGTIKTSEYREPAHPLSAFQFHMVRLRRAWNWQKPCAAHISIPHGTIKTLINTVRMFTYMISIPHGTIKTSNRPSVASVSIEFQFHMVRLRRSPSRPWHPW